MFDQLLSILNCVWQNSVFVCLAFGLLYLISVRKSVDNFHKDHIKSYCGNDRCVRCHMYSKIIEVAQRRLQVFEKPKDIKIARAIATAIEKTKHLNKCEPSDKSTQFPNVLFYPDLDAFPWWDDEHVKLKNDVAVLEDSFDMIYREMQNLVTHQESGSWKRNVTPTGSWDVFSLVNQGCWIKENMEICPKTSDIISGLNSVLLENGFGNVMFSVIKPGTAITEHYGPTNIRLRCHLGLVTSPHCKLTVCEKRRTWEQGKCFIFDDSFLHSVQHSGPNSSESRVVFIVDLWHPGIRKREREILNYAFSIQE